MSDSTRILHHWTDSDSQEWACGAYDHGPFCRLCQPVDGTLAACLRNVDEALFDWKVGPDGEFSFALTPKGLATVDQITAVPVIAEMMDVLYPGWRENARLSAFEPSRETPFAMPDRNWRPADD